MRGDLIFFFPPFCGVALNFFSAERMMSELYLIELPGKVCYWVFLYFQCQCRTQIS